VACVIGPFNDSSINYLLVADYNQQNVYQLQPATRELRSLFTDRIFTVAMALDPPRRIVYLIYVQSYNSRRFRIRKRSFDDNVNSDIYYASSGTVALHYELFVKRFLFLFHVDFNYAMLHEGLPIGRRTVRL